MNYRSIIAALAAGIMLACCSSPGNGSSINAPAAPSQTAGSSQERTSSRSFYTQSPTNNSDEAARIAPTGRLVQRNTTWTLTQIARFLHPEGLAVTTSGSIYFMNSKGTQLKRVTGSGRVQNVARGFELAYGIGGGLNGAVYVADTHVDEVVRVLNGKQNVIPGSWLPESVQADGNGNIYVYDIDNGGAVVKDHVASGKTTTIFSNASCYSGGATGLAVTSSGTVFVTCVPSGTIYQVDKNGNVTTLCSGLKSLRVITVDPNGNVYAQLGMEGLVECTSQGAVIQQDVPNDLGAVNGMVWYDNAIYASSRTDYIVKLTPSSK